MQQGVRGQVRVRGAAKAEGGGTAAEASPHHAELKAEACSTRDDRIRFIQGLMVDLEWFGKGGKGRAQKRELAALWGVEECTVREYAAEASNRLKLDPDEREQLHAALLNKLHGLLEDAATTPNNVTGQCDLRTAADIVEKIAIFAGIRLDKDAAPAEQHRVIIDLVGPGAATETESEDDE